MREVNKSDETIDESLTRINGTFFWNRGKTKQLIQELTDKQDLDDENDYENTLDAEKLITKYGSPRDLKVMMNIKNKHDEVGQLGIRDKKIRDGLHQKYLQKIKDGTAFNNDKFTPIKESGSWNKICEQLEKPRLNLNSRSFFGQLRESLQTKNKRRLLTMKRVNQYE